MLRDDPTRKNGVYILSEVDKPNTEVFCEFSGNKGIKFYPRDLNVAHWEAVDVDHVIVRHQRSDGFQYDTEMRQIRSHTTGKLSLQFNNHQGYAAPQNSANMGPYIYLGFLPEFIADSKTEQGYRANGKDVTFKNCDAKPNSYMAFFFNPDNNDPTSKKEVRRKRMRQWIAVSTNATENLPPRYFYQVEMHMCGGYMVSGKGTFTDIIGAAVGIPFTLN